MTKTIPLIAANLKGFARNWKSVLLLIIFPLLLITAVFLSFNPNGLQKVPVGVTGSTAEFPIDTYKSTYFPYLEFTKFNDVSTCLTELKEYKQYACLDIHYVRSLHLNIYYDNTREPVAREIVERIKTAINLLQKQKSKQMASVFLKNVTLTMNKVDGYKSQLGNTSTEIQKYMQYTDDSIKKLKTSKSELSSTISSMDNDIAGVKAVRSSVGTAKDDIYGYSTYYLDQSMELAGANDMLGEDVAFFDGEADYYLSSADNKIGSYEQASANGKKYIKDMDSGIKDLEKLKKELAVYNTKLNTSQVELASIQKQFNSVKSINLDYLVSPISLRNKPVYVPAVSRKDLDSVQNKTNAEIASAMLKGVNLINLQTLYPSILFLMALFLSLLISGFICVRDINSPASGRLRLIRGLFGPQILSVYVSSLLVIIVPLVCVLLVGNYLFRLSIASNVLMVGLILFMLSSIFILVGMALAYLIKKESTTLLVNSFVLVFLIFLSGFILPVEKMSSAASAVAKVLPGKVALNAFNKVVFYNQVLSAVAVELLMLGLWLAGMVLVVMAVKKLRNA